MYSQTKHKERKHFCMYCLQCFSSERVLTDHKANCLLINGVQAVKMPTKDHNILKFNHHHKQLPLPFVIYADFEAITEKVQGCQQTDVKSFTEAYQKHTDCGYGYKVVCTYDDKYTKPIQIYRGEKAVYKFMEHMLEEVRYCKKIIKSKFNKPLKMTEEDEKQFQNADTCHICEQKYTNEDIRVRDHCHITGKFRGSAHQDCNLNFRISDKIPVIFHNLRGYDSHFIMQEIGEIVKNNRYTNKKGEECEMNINVIPNNMEKYMAFMLGNNLTFIDSFQFMSSSLDKLVNNLPKEAFKYTSEQFKKTKFELMTRKENATIEIQKHDLDHEKRHRRIVEDLNKIRSKAEEVWNKIDHSTLQMKSYHSETTQHYNETMENLKTITDTIGYLIEVTDHMQDKIDNRLGWLTRHLGGTGDKPALVTTCLMHAGYFLLATLCIFFLNTPLFTWLFVLVFVPIIAWMEISFDSSFTCGTLSCIIAEALLGKWLYIYLKKKFFSSNAENYLNWASSPCRQETPNDTENMLDTIDSIESLDDSAVTLKPKGHVGNTRRQLNLAFPDAASTPSSCHEMILLAKFKGAVFGDSVLRIVEPSLGFAEQHDLLLARVLAQPKDDMVPIRVINPSPTPVTLYQNTSVVTFSQLEDSALKPACCNQLTTRKPEQARLLVSEQFNLNTMNLTSPHRKELTNLLDEFTDIFSSGPADLGQTGIVQHRIDTGDHPHIKQAPRRVPMHQQGTVRQHIDDMLQHGVIQPSTSPWAAPIVLVRKKGRYDTLLVDYRKLNDVTRKDAYPLPHIDETLDALAGAKVFTTLDLASGYWQVEVDVADREKTAFTTRHGLFEFQVMPIGLCNAPGTLQRLMVFVLAGLQWQTCLVYLDDVIVYGRDFDEHLKRVPYLGHAISAEGVSTDPAKIAAVQQWPVSSKVTDVRTFLGSASYYRRFIQNFAEIALPLHRLTAKTAEKFKWNADCDVAFRVLKQKLVAAPALAFPSFNQEFVVDCDASDYGLGAVISQRQD
ncbi:Retrovirus-related Pol polyprotein from transposon 17.6 [Stylophora pistillata]|uniref:Retrovirus-related Pol polyprotein from transposon 17.6 n=1 Tax=Stylophora pistillata TaxID=50429 RepID=A0A2B4RN39_STYPI|nr:Retrovirus-related Pol polyprotein from transposon 17.6 [Stylophora pistillata]